MKLSFHGGALLVFLAARRRFLLPLLTVESEFVAVGPRNLHVNQLYVGYCFGGLSVRPTARDGGLP